MFFTFPEDAHWNAERQAVEFGVEIGEYSGVVRVPWRVFQRLLPERPTPERCVEAYYLQRSRFESIAACGLFDLVRRNPARIELFETAAQSWRRYENGDAMPGEAKLSSHDSPLEGTGFEPSVPLLPLRSAHRLPVVLSPAAHSE